MKVSYKLVVAVLLLAAAVSAQKYLALDLNQDIQRDSFTLLDSQNGIKFNKKTKIAAFVLQNGQKEEAVQNAIFISHIPQERLSVVRCGNLSKESQGRIDLDLGSKFEEFFLKRNFTLTISEKGDECFGFSVLYQRNYTHLISSNEKILQRFNSFISSSFPEVSADGTFSLSFAHQFEIEINYNSKSLIRFVRVASASVKYAEEIKSTIPIILGDKFEIFKGNVKETPEYLSDRSFYSSSFYRQADGTGLHQKSLIEFKFGVTKEQYKPDSQNGCEVVIVDYLDNTQYVDFDELYLHESLNLTNYRVHDIERPSSQSPQHIYMLKYRFKESDITNESGRLVLKMNETFLFHYRYRTPFEGSYKSSFMNTQPQFLVNCVNHHKKSTLGIQTSMIERMVNAAFNTTNFRQVQSLQTPQQAGVMERKIPVGNIADKKYTLYITIFLTVSVSIFLAFKILNVASKYNL